MTIFIVSCSQTEDVIQESTFQIDYGFTSENLMTRSAEYDSFHEKYINGRLLTPDNYSLIFVGKTNKLIVRIDGHWKDKEFLTLPSDEYVVSGKSYPNIQKHKYVVCSDTVYLTFQDTIKITNSTKYIKLKANYDCSLFMLDNINTKSCTLEYGFYSYNLKNTESVYHVFVRSIVSGSGHDIIRTFNDNSKQRITIDKLYSNYGSYYHFKDINGDYDLPPMNEVP